MVEFGEKLGDGGRPETPENYVVFFGADALVDNAGSGGAGGNAVTHERLRDKSEGALMEAEGLPGVPVDIALEI